MTIDLETLHLAAGQHEGRNKGVCLLEAVAWFAGQPHTDHPPCVSPVLGAYGRGLNDVLPDESRQRLIPAIPALPGTAGDGRDEIRGFIVVDWLARVYVPAWLDLVPALAGSVVALRGLPRVVNPDIERAAFQALAAAGDAARDAAWAAARDAAWAAAGDAAWAAAWAAAGDAAWAAARAAAGAAAGAAARAATRAAARAAAGDAARDATGAALAPTVARLQESAIALFPALIAGEWPDDVQ